MTIKAKILVQRFEHHKYLYSYKLFFDQDCTATHGKFLSEEDAKIHAEVLAKRIKVNLKWEATRSVADGLKIEKKCNQFYNMQEANYKQAISEL